MYATGALLSSDVFNIYALCFPFVLPRCKAQPFSPRVYRRNAVGIEKLEVHFSLIWVSQDEREETFPCGCDAFGCVFECGDEFSAAIHLHN
jgi:hypothetical protein